MSLTGASPGAGRGAGRAGDVLRRLRRPPRPRPRSTAMTDGEVLLLENTRFHAGEEKNDPAFADALAALGDVYVNDAFSAAHRAHASTEGLARLLPACAGRLMEAELKALEEALGHPRRPVVAVVGGAKVSTKLDLLSNLVRKVDQLVIGGGMANTFLAAAGHRRRQVAGRARPGRHRPADHAQGRRGRLRDRAAHRRRRRRASSRPAPRPETVARRRLPRRHDDPRRRPRDGRRASPAPSRTRGR